MIYNDTEEGRHSLAVSLSGDEGKTWQWSRHLELADPNAGSFAYPSLIQADDGMLHATFSYRNGPRGTAIKHAKFNVEWITARD